MFHKHLLSKHWMNTCPYFYAQTHSPTGQEYLQRQVVRSSDMKPQVPSVGSPSIVTDETESSPHRRLTNPKANVREEEMRIHQHQVKNWEMHWMWALNLKYRKESEQWRGGKKAFFHSWHGHKRGFLYNQQAQIVTILTVRKYLWVKIQTAETSLPEAGGRSKVSLEGTSRTLRGF